MKISYFNFRGSAETSRLMLAQAGVEYEDLRWERNEFPEHKPNMKWGTAPMLEDGDLCLGQSKTIARYLANKYGFAGKTNIEQYAVDAIVDTLHDFLTPLGKYLFSDDEEVKSKGLEDFKKGAPTFIGTLVKRLEKNGGTYMVGDGLTWADFGVYNVIYSLKSIAEGIEGFAEMMESMAPLNAVHDMVAVLPHIQKWVESRPQTTM